jgi:uncharacterized protein
LTIEVDDTLVDRMCLVTRVVADEAELIRFARSPDGQVVPDLKRKLPGRGVWVGVSAVKLHQAIAKNLFARGFGETCVVSPDLTDQVRHLLRKEALASFSLARKAGIAQTGFMKVEAALGRTNTVLLVHATEAAPDGCQKLDRQANSAIKITNLFTGDELSLAFGQANVIHAAVTRGGMAGKLLDMIRRVELFDAPPDVL